MELEFIDQKETLCKNKRMWLIIQFNEYIILKIIVYMCFISFLKKVLVEINT